MAKFKSIVTDSGVEALTALIASGQGLNLTRATAGSGVPDVSPNTLSGLINPEDVTANLAGKEFVDGTPAIMRIPVQITNEALEANVWVREIGVFGQDINGKEILFCYGWLDGEDSDNVIPATSFEDGADTVHIHDLAVFITNQEAAAVSVQVGARYVRFVADGLCAYVRRLETCDTLTPEVAIPRSERESYVVDRKEFLQRLTYLKECASPAKTTPVVYFENGCLSLQTPSARYRAAIELPGRSEVAFAFNLSYMWDALQQFSGHEKVRLHVLSPVSPVTITAEGTDDVALVLPVRYRAAA